MIFAFLIVSGLMVTDNFTVDWWVKPFYFLSYKYGFCSKMLIGTIVNCIFGNSVSEPLIKVIAAFAIVVLCFLIALFFGKILRVAEQRGSNWGIYFIVLLYLACPARISNYFAPAFNGRFEVYIFMLVLLALYIFFTKKQDFKFWLSMSLICLLCTVIHQIFIFIFFPIILALMIYNLYEQQFNKETVFGTFAVCTTTAISFLYFQFFAKFNIINEKMLMDIINSRYYYYRELSALHDPIICEYYSTLKDQTFQLVVQYMPALFYKALLTFILLIPLFFVFIVIWRNAYKNCIDNKSKILLIAMQMCGLIYIPTFIFACDWGRWIFFFITFQFALLFILWYKKCQPIVTAIESIGDYCKEHIFIAAILLLYLMRLHGIVDFYLVVEAGQIYQYINTLHLHW